MDIKPEALIRTEPVLDLGTGNEIEEEEEEEEEKRKKEETEKKEEEPFKIKRTVIQVMSSLQ